ncbi:MAG: PDZ domain-containing protein [Myxococcales bacterium]|nr:PDZ domain-containing protein [Myxococcales bacterium]
MTRIVPGLAVCALLALLPSAARGSASGAVPVASPRKGRGKVGMVISAITRGAEVRHVVPNSPAHRAGLRPFDRIIKVDGQPLAKLSIHQIVARITGPPGTQVTLGVERGNRYLLLTLMRTSLKGALNDALRSRKVKRLVRRIRRAQGKIAAVKGVTLELATKPKGRRRLRMMAGKQGYRFELCSAFGHIAGGDDGRRWGSMPAEAPTRHRAEDLMARPHGLLPNLAIADFTDPNYTVKFVGRTRLYPPHLSRPLEVQRFVVENEVYDFSVKRLRLVRYQREDKRVFYFDGWSRRAGVLVPSAWRIGNTSYKLASIKLVPPSAVQLGSTHPACGAGAKKR